MARRSGGGGRSACAGDYGRVGGVGDGRHGRIRRVGARLILIEVSAVVSLESDIAAVVSVKAPVLNARGFWYTARARARKRCEGVGELGEARVALV